VTDIIEKADPVRRVSYSLLAGSGLRIGEALGLRVEHFSKDRRVIRVEQSAFRNIIQTPKTKNAFREVDICPELAEFIDGYIQDRTSGLLFPGDAGLPLCQTNLLMRSLHPIQVTLKIELTGFHAFRRFRATWLRKQKAREDLIKFWLGHSDSSITDRYVKLDEDTELRSMETASIGLGFTLPDTDFGCPQGTNCPQVESGNVVESSR
jgi:integrase